MHLLMLDAPDFIVRPSNGVVCTQYTQQCSTGCLWCVCTWVAGEQEGQLAFMGATASLAGSSKGSYCLVFDLGGRSSEFAVGEPSHSRLAFCRLLLCTLAAFPVKY